MSETLRFVSGSAFKARQEVLPLGMLFLVWAATRAVLWVFYVPTTGMDTGTYQLLADQIAGLDFQHYNGQRTLGYPLLILLAQNNYMILWVIQSILGFFTALLVYLLVRSHTGRWSWALAAGLLSLTALNLMFFEAAIVTETASAFLLAWVSYLFVRFIQGGCRIRAALILGVMAAILVLTRPQFVFVILLLPLLILVFTHARARQAALVVFLMATVPVLGWMAINKMTVGHFSLTTLLGYNLTNHSGSFIEYAPDEYSIIRDIYLKYRQQKLEQTGSHHMTVFWARQELLAASGLSEVELSSQLQKLSVELIKAHPGLYAKSVAKAWASFWMVPNYWELEKLGAVRLSEALHLIWAIQHPALRACNAFFLGMSVILTWQWLRHPEQASECYWVPLFLCWLVMAVSVVQSLVEYGENPRYFIPTQPLVLAAVIMAAADMVRRIREGGHVPQTGKKGR